jgi:hypothetical protein
MFSVPAATFGVQRSATGRIRRGELDAAFFQAANAIAGTAAVAAAEEETLRSIW